jgi:hypothetical protein
MARGRNGQEILDEPMITTEVDGTLSGIPVIITFKKEDGTEIYGKFYPTKV